MIISAIISSLLIRGADAIKCTQSELFRACWIQERQTLNNCKSDTRVLQHSKGIAIFATAKTRRTLFLFFVRRSPPPGNNQGVFVRIKIYLLFLSLYYPDMSTGNNGIICLSLYTAFGSRAAWFICLCKTSGLDLLKPIPLCLRYKGSKNINTKQIYMDIFII